VFLKITRRAVTYHYLNGYSFANLSRVWLHSQVTC